MVNSESVNTNRQSSDAAARLRFTLWLSTLPTSRIILDLLATEARGLAQQRMITIAAANVPGQLVDPLDGSSSQRYH